MSSSSSSSTSAEAITLQLGSAANYAGAHFWNLDAANYDAEESADRLYFEAHDGRWFPRLLAVDDKGACGTLDCADLSGGRGEGGGPAQSSSATGWDNRGAGLFSETQLLHMDSFPVQRIDQEPLRQHEYNRYMFQQGDGADNGDSQSDVDLSDANEDVAEDLLEGNYISGRQERLLFDVREQADNASSRRRRRRVEVFDGDRATSVARSPSSTWERVEAIGSSGTFTQETTSRNCGRPIRFWSDYLQLDYAPRWTVFERPQYAASSTSSSLPCATSGFSRDEMTALQDDYLRRLVERCDRLDTVHLVADAGRAEYANLALDLAEYCRQEQPKVCVVGFETFCREGLGQDLTSSSGGGQEQDNRVDKNMPEDVHIGGGVQLEHRFHWLDVVRGRFYQRAREQGLLDTLFSCEVPYGCKSKTGGLFFEETADLAMAMHLARTSFTGKKSYFTARESTFWRSFESSSSWAKEFFLGAANSGERAQLRPVSSDIRSFSGFAKSSGEMSSTSRRAYQQSSIGDSSYKFLESLCTSSAKCFVPGKTHFNVFQPPFAILNRGTLSTVGTQDPLAFLNSFSSNSSGTDVQIQEAQKRVGAFLRSELRPLYLPRYPWPGSSRSAQHRDQDELSPSPRRERTPHTSQPLEETSATLMFRGAKLESLSVKESLKRVRQFPESGLEADELAEVREWWNRQDEV
ncbi:unnamed protein product [Amoebophrya sp. A25]|nr:unnamed protein product [Amoebophrya sp. A25]|eukprot:GSA25T00021622001.1